MCYPTNVKWDVEYLAHVVFVVTDVWQEVLSKVKDVPQDVGPFFITENSILRTVIFGTCFDQYWDSTRQPCGESTDFGKMHAEQWRTRAPRC